MIFAAALAGGLLAAPAARVAAQGTSDFSGYGPHMMWAGGWYGMILGPLFMVLVIAAALAIVVVVVRALGGSAYAPPPPQAPPHPARPTSLDLLKERYARGEIEKAEFEERRRTLGD